MKKLKPLELYIHIPFCEKKCAYCDFLSMPTREEQKELYCEALIKEVHSYKDKFKEYEVKTIFFGGGTPSSVNPKHIKDILTNVYEVFAIKEPANLEITIECNPGTLTKEKLQCYKEAGINRISMGLQSTDNHELKLLGRIHTYEEFLHNYHLVKEVGFDNINIDLMSALPGQTVESYEKTLRRILALEPTHISAYSLIIEEGTPFFKQYGEDMPKEGELPSEEADREMYHLTKYLLQKHGYQRYEISNYAKPGYECQHNIGYWTDVEYIGMGLGASSYIEKTRYCNESQLESYIEMIQAEKDIKRDVRAVSEKENMEEMMFLGLRLTKGVSKEQFNQTFETTVEEVYGDVLKRFENEGLLEENDQRIRLTEEGLDVSNYIMSEFILDQ